MDAAELSRPEQLAQVRKVLRDKFPKAKFSTNDDANPATPMTVTASWNNGRILKTVRADSPTSTPDQFASKAIAVLAPFQDNNVPSRHLT